MPIVSIPIWRAGDQVEIEPRARGENRFTAWPVVLRGPMTLTSTSARADKGAMASTGAPCDEKQRGIVTSPSILSDMVRCSSESAGQPHPSWCVGDAGEAVPTHRP